MDTRGDATQRQRIDKWLWAARFFKTRSLASEAIQAGRIRLNGEAPKPAREVHPGDTLEIAHGPRQWTVIVRALNEQRRPAAEAERLYEETAASRARREALQETLRLAPAPGSGLKGRPTKKARRQIHRFERARQDPA
ncbi:MAG: RNA-binding S4 domain-containing protein [Candidatus Accumulibacter sp.]|jgi:ribosome-associated heat shock protein Hsp15|nr:RNA-binding S4 domain-containing protein [Accumulibacter sp.]